MNLWPKPVVLRCLKKESTVHYGYMKSRTHHARVFSRTLGYGNSKNEIRQRHGGRGN